MTEPGFYKAFFGEIEMWELILILFIVMILFGVGKLSQVGEAVEKAIRIFKDAAAGKSESDNKSDPTDSTQKPA
ncbi:MAG: twin-arginine translocase TatA/TatE family subunit [Pseudomonadota bacterium]